MHHMYALSQITKEFNVLNILERAKLKKKLLIY